MKTPGTPTKNKGWILTLLGACLFIAAIFAGSYAVAHQLHQDHAAQILIKSEREAIAKVSAPRRRRSPKSAATLHGANCQLSGVKSGQLSGILSIPSLNLKAPVEEGTDDAELNVAVGHDPYSVWPGLNGAAVFLAHDVSYFVHLNSLSPGDIITYQTACNTVQFRVSGSQVVAGRLSGVQHVGAQPGARHLLPAQRLVLHHQAAAGPGHRGLGPDQGQQPQVGGQGRDRGKSVDYIDDRARPARRPGPHPGPELRPHGHHAAGQRLGGLLPVARARSTSSTPRSRPTSVASTPGRQRQAAWWAALAPGLAMPPQLLGASASPHYDAPLNVEVDSDRSGTPTQVVLHYGGHHLAVAAPRVQCTETVVLPVHGATVTIGSWQFS